MRDNYTFRPNWYRSEVHAFAGYDRAQRRHALAIAVGSLTGLVLSLGVVYIISR
jgi:hypothetical protein